MAKILLVDDDPLILRMYKTAFDYRGFDVETAEDGKQGLDKILKNKYDLIIFDVMMPNMDGVDLLTKIKEIPGSKNIPSIALTNLKAAQSEEETIKEGVDRYIIKSEFKPREIVDIAEKLLSDRVKTSV
ncbi:MAG: Two component LuxR family transcriptional regulator [Microgenomates group bacterium GW2011_GWC1_37_8]|uniref:Two component LuxR family transcriptional regulator n=2 Tax=Candidatus Woeseibacteriota TaxID=1752722 RepID=A0A0G0NHP3_9BACT|nr:MAG: Two component LuxR family transcriptional regulator [Microgenomates group bacterium GW2011_GWC1_37_8]KKQ85429.1 MAG: Two component LuxR family transcriptional regulator [Candidatus Woesebacteria bacterium GW2011_GWB1_38_8]OGM20002.1 MAG: hypothetical protein A2863_03475 [Candidatus Woesebacteria bacterium RIFCSPHIGHO2_01_FULL_38_9b]